MIGLGTIVNAALVIIGGIIGLLFKGGIKERYQDIITKSIGLCVIFVGISGTLSKMFVIQNNSLETRGALMIILSLVLGSILGEWINIELHTENFAKWLRVKVKSEKDPLFVEGFITTSLTICVGAMAIVGSLEDGLTGDATMLYTKAILDCVIVIVFSSTFGKGAIFSVLPVIALQGSVTLLAQFIQPILTDQCIQDLSMVGNMLIFCIGLNLMFQTKMEVKTRKKLGT